MRCTSKKKAPLCAVICAAALLFAGCGAESEIANAYYLYGASTSGSESAFFAQDLCVTDDFDYGTDQTDSQVAEGAGLFNLDTEEVDYSQNLFGKLYPASTTKILTAEIIIGNCDLGDEVTVSETAMDGLDGSSVCGLSVGDTLTVRDLLYGLLLSSGNDAANVLAEYYSGSVEAFAEVMNEEALRLGATGSHFVNPHGLPDEDHYTTVYDMYLITQAAIELDTFVEIIQTPSVTVTLENASGQESELTFSNTCRYTSGSEDAPDGITVIGGKTGTTNAAGYCLVVYATNEKGERLIGIVFKADSRGNLYLLMNQILNFEK
ncbi:MAG: serine hydrolase [Clostridiales bacterium]|nr:serine hydrolase [Clostridiales bacterium]